jgi:Tol biopolymer transport system component
MGNMPNRLLGGRGFVAAGLLAALACGDGGTAPAFELADRDRHARFTANGQTVVYYRNNEGPGPIVGIYRVAVTDGTPVRVVQALLAGLDLHPQTDSIVFSARASGASEPGLWIIGLDGGGLRSLGGGGSSPGWRWPAFSADGTRLSWEVRYQDQLGRDTARNLWIGEWQNGAIVNPRAVAPGRRSAWRPDGAALAVERWRPGAVPPNVILVLDTTGQILDTLGLGEEPAWRPDGAEVAYLAIQSDRGCLGVCFVPAGGGTPAPLSSGFMSFAGSWSRDGAEYVFTRLMGTYEIEGNPPLIVEESRLWIRTLATGADRQVTF